MRTTFLDVIPGREAIARYRQEVKDRANRLAVEYDKLCPGMGARIKRRSRNLARALERSRRNSFGMDRRKYRH